MLIFSQITKMADFYGSISTKLSKYYIFSARLNGTEYVKLNNLTNISHSDSRLNLRYVPDTSQEIIFGM